MTITSRLGRLSSGMSLDFPLAVSPGINSALIAEPLGNDGRGVCIPRRCPSCGNALTSDRAYCALSFCLAYDALKHASENQNPLGHINRDKTGLRMVRKGCKVDYHGMTFLVQRVRKGVAYGQTLLQKQYFFAPTNSVKVVR